jgi:hypothetical protein
MKAYRILSQKNPQVVEDQSRVLPTTTQDHVDSVPIGSFERVAMQKSVNFHVSHDLFDTVASFELTLDAARLMSAELNSMNHRWDCQSEALPGRIGFGKRVCFESPVGATILWHKPEPHQERMQLRRNPTPVEKFHRN